MWVESVLCKGQYGVCGLGYVGLSTLALLAYRGCHVVGYDCDLEKIECLKRGGDPLGNPLLAEVLLELRPRLRWSGQVEGVADCEQIFCALPINTVGDEGYDARELYELVDQILLLREGKESCFWIRSTIDEDVYLECVNRFAHRGARVLLWPEFLRQQLCWEDILQPFRVVVGGGRLDLELARSLIEFCYPQQEIKVFYTDPKTAILAKSFSNAYLMTRLAFINQVNQYAEMVKADRSTLLEVLTLDPRVGEKYFTPGLGVGGTCLPKDMKGLSAFASGLGFEENLFSSILTCEESYQSWALKEIEAELDSLGERCTLLWIGIGFAKNSNFLSKSVAYRLAKKLSHLAKHHFLSLEEREPRLEVGCWLQEEELESFWSKADLVIVHQDLKPELLKKIRALRSQRPVKVMDFTGRYLTGS